jgi:hypothetical protein
MGGEEQDNSGSIWPHFLARNDQVSNSKTGSSLTRLALCKGSQVASVQSGAIDVARLLEQFKGEIALIKHREFLSTGAK